MQKRKRLKIGDFIDTSHGSGVILSILDWTNKIATFESMFEAQEWMDEQRSILGDEWRFSFRVYAVNIGDEIKMVESDKIKVSP